VLLVFLSITVLYMRPGGLRRQLRFAARRLRLMLVLGGIYIVASAVFRLAFPDSFIADWGPPAVAIVLAVVFMIVGQDPRPAETESPTRT